LIKHYYAHLNNFEVPNRTFFASFLNFN